MTFVPVRISCAKVINYCVHVGKSLGTRLVLNYFMHALLSLRVDIIVIRQVQGYTVFINHTLTNQITVFRVAVI